jgi:hypothetical protein
LLGDWWNAESLPPGVCGCWGVGGGGCPANWQTGCPLALVGPVRCSE